MMKEGKFDLQERFIAYAVEIILLSEQLPETKAGRHICDQILRSDRNIFTWILDIPCWILDIQIFHILRVYPLKMKTIFFCEEKVRFLWMILPQDQQ